MEDLLVENTDSKKLSGDNSYSSLYCNNIKYKLCITCMNNIRINNILFRKTFCPTVEINKHLAFNIWLSHFNIIANNNDFFTGFENDVIKKNEFNSVEHEVPKSVFLNCNNVFEKKNVNEYYNFIYTDLHNIIYGDKYINMLRGHIPYGMINNGNDNINVNRNNKKIERNEYNIHNKNHFGTNFNSSDIWFLNQENKKLYFSSASVVELPDVNKGIYARTFFYMLFVYGNMMCNDVNKIRDKYYFSNKFIETMKIWNTSYPPNEREKLLNQRKYILFGVCNPFIINNLLIDKICVLNNIVDEHEHITIDINSNIKYNNNLYEELICKSTQNKEINIEEYYEHFILHNKDIVLKSGYYRNETIEKDVENINKYYTILNLDNDNFNKYIDENIKNEYIVLDMLKEIKPKYDETISEYVFKRSIKNQNPKEKTEKKKEKNEVIINKEEQDRVLNERNANKEHNMKDESFDFENLFLKKYLKYKKKYLKYKIFIFKK